MTALVRYADVPFAADGMIEPLQPDEVLESYVDTLTKHQQEADAAKEFGLARMEALLGEDGKPSPVTSQEEYEAVAAVLQAVDAKAKFLDQERKVSVKPLNDEVKRVNAWFNPAIEVLKSTREVAERMMAGWILEQKKEKDRLKLVAAEAAKKQLEDVVRLALKDPQVAAAELAKIPSMSSATGTMGAAAATDPPKVVGLTHKAAWAWSFADEKLFLVEMVKRAASGDTSALVFLTPNLKKIDEYIDKMEDRSPLPGVKVFEDVSFRNSAKKK